LKPATTYFFCAAAANAGGAAFGSLVTFTTPATAPSVKTVSADVTEGGVIMNGAATPNGAPTTAWFRYDSVQPSACDDAFGTRTPESGGADLGAGTDEAPFA